MDLSEKFKGYNVRVSRRTPPAGMSNGGKAVVATVPSPRLELGFGQGLLGTFKTEGEAPEIKAHFKGVPTEEAAGIWMKTAKKLSPLATTSSRPHFCGPAGGKLCLKLAFGGRENSLLKWRSRPNYGRNGSRQKWGTGLWKGKNITRRCKHSRFGITSRNSSRSSPFGF